MERGVRLWIRQLARHMQRLEQERDHLNAQMDENDEIRRNQLETDLQGEGRQCLFAQFIRDLTDEGRSQIDLLGSGISMRKVTA